MIFTPARPDLPELADEMPAVGDVRGDGVAVEQAGAAELQQRLQHHGDDGRPSLCGHLPGPLLPAVEELPHQEPGAHRQLRLLARSGVQQLRPGRRGVGGRVAGAHAVTSIAPIMQLPLRFKSYS